MDNLKPNKGSKMVYDKRTEDLAIARVDSILSDKMQHLQTLRDAANELGNKVTAEMFRYAVDKIQSIRIDIDKAFHTNNTGRGK